VTDHAHHLYIFRYDGAAFSGLTRDQFVATLRAEGIPCSAGYRPLYREAAIRASVASIQRALGRTDAPIDVSLPETERACAEGVWLPQNLLLGAPEDLRDVVTAIQKIQRATWSAGGQTVTSSAAGA
jgi:dTDP-4-amino-4,6-dideoxygalactose transaminase